MSRRVASPSSAEPALHPSNSNGRSPPRPRPRRAATPGVVASWPRERGTGGPRAAAETGGEAREDRESLTRAGLHYPLAAPALRLPPFFPLLSCSPALDRERSQASFASDGCSPAPVPPLIATAS